MNDLLAGDELYNSAFAVGPQRCQKQQLKSYSALSRRKRCTLNSTQ